MATLRLFWLFGAGMAVLAQQPSIVAVRNGASYSEMLAPGCWSVVAGSGFGTAATTATTLPLPKVLGGVSVTFDGRQAPLLYVSPTQINALIPYEVVAGDNRAVPVVVTTPQGTSQRYTAYVNRTAPAVFTRDSSGTGPAHVFDGNFRPVEVVSPGDVILLYAAGLGQTNPPAATDSPPDPATLYRVANEIEVFAGEQKAQVLYASLAPGYPGVYQLNVRVPALWTNRLYLRSGNWLSNVAEVGVSRRDNAGEVTAEIEPLFPSAGLAVDTSLVFEAARYRVSVAVSPKAATFLVAAAGQAGGCFTRVDRANGMYETNCTASTEAAMAGDYSALAVPVIDFRMGCVPFPGKVVPRVRMDPGLLSPFAMMDFLVPTVTFPGYPGGVGEQAGAFPASADRLEISQAFGDWVQLPCGALKERKTKFTIYVDGRPIIARDVTYAIGGR